MINTIKRNAVGILSSFLFLLITIIFLIEVAPIHVLRNWHISVPSKPYHRGETLPLESTASKLRQARGEAHRTVECNSGKDSVVAYPLNVSTANRPPGTRSTLTYLILPTNITNTPVTCRIIISVTYKVYKIRKVTENAVSNNFTVLP